MRTSEPKQFAPRAIRWVAWIGILATIIGSRLWLISVFGSSLPFLDQWDGEAAFLFKPWLEGHFGWGDLFGPHNEHRIVPSRLLALGLLRLNGQWDAQLEMTANAVLCGIIGVAVAAAASRFFSRQAGLPVFVAVILWLALPYAQENTLWGFQSCFYFLLLFSLGAIWGLGFHRIFSVAWWVGAICSVLACLSMGSGFLATTIVILLAISRAIRQRTWTWQQAIAVFLAALVVGGGLLLYRDYPPHAALRAVSPLVWATVFARCLAWPFCGVAVLAVLTYAPVAWLAVRYLKSSRTADRNNSGQEDRMELLLAVELWVMLQAAAVAYSRGGNGTEPIASRYMDILALGALVNAGAVGILLGSLPRLRSLKVCGYLWFLVVIAGATVTSYQEVKSQTGRQVYLQVAEQNVRAYVATGDRKYMEGNPPPDIPYPHPSRLIELLDDPLIREILPAGVRPALRIEPENNQAGAFTPGGYPSYIVNPTNERSWGSYSAGGAQATGTMETRTLAPRWPYLQIDLAGYLREGMSLHLRSATGAREIPFIPKTRINTSWRTGMVPLPASETKIVARDENPNEWFAFREPREVGRFSFYADNLVRKGSFLCLLGLIFLFPAFLWSAASAIKKRRHT